MCIVWIDDDADIIEPVTELLKRSGYEFIHLHSAAQALDSVDLIRSCDLLLLDMILPSGVQDQPVDRVAGLALLRRLRAEYDIRVPVIVFSVVDPRSLGEDLDNLGAKHLRKPALPSELKDAVDAVLNTEDASGMGGSPSPEASQP